MHKLTIKHCDGDHKEMWHEVLHCNDRHTLQWYANVLKNRNEDIQYRIEEEEDE